MDDEKPPAEVGDDTFSVSRPYRLASAADRALIDEALSELLHTLYGMPGTADEPWLAEARHDAEDDEGWVPVIIV